MKKRYVLLSFAVVNLLGLLLVKFDLEGFLWILVPTGVLTLLIVAAMAIREWWFRHTI